MPGWFAALDEGQRRVVVALAALVAALALAVGAVALTDDDPSQATVRTEDETTSSAAGGFVVLRSTSTTATSPSSTSTTVGRSTSTTKAKAGAGGSTTTIRRSGGGTGTTKATATTKPPPTTTTAPASGGGACATGGGAGGQMATLFCNHRAQLGLPSMVRNGELDAMAQEWAQKMATDGALSHRPNAQARTMVAAACVCPGWAENVAFDDTVQDAFTGWLNSTSGHRQHIEDPRDGEYGIGVASGGGFLWFVQVFGYY